MRTLILFMLLGISVAASGQPYTSYQINFKGYASATIDGDIKVIDAMIPSGTFVQSQVIKIAHPANYSFTLNNQHLDDFIATCSSDKFSLTTQTSNGENSYSVFTLNNLAPADMHKSSQRLVPICNWHFLVRDFQSRYYKTTNPAKVSSFVF